MGKHISFCNVHPFGLEKCHRPTSLEFCVVTITNAGDLFGYSVSTYLADEYVGLVDLHAGVGFVVVVLVHAWIGGRFHVVLGIFYGSVSGTFVSLGGEVLFSWMDGLQIMGMCLGMIIGMCGLGLRRSNPKAGALVGPGG